jgi:N-acetylglucosamine-6-phosphate deacetylase
VTILTDARVVQDDQVVEGGWVRWEGERLAEVGRGHLPVDRHRSAGGWLGVPGFVDIHVHGGGAAASRPALPRTAPRSRASIDGTAPPPCWPDSSPHHLRTSCGRSLPWPSWSMMRSWPGSTWKGRSCHRLVVVRTLRSSCEPRREPPSSGSSAAGPAPSAWRPWPPSWTAASTPSPSSPRRGRCRPSVTPTPPTTSPTRRWTLGPGVATHLFNAMRPIHHREPGVVMALMERPEVVCELINDGLHLHPSLVRWVLGTVGEVRAALVSDAIAAAGADDGLYALGGSSVRVRDGRAELVDGSSLAGSTLTMDAAFRRAVRFQGLPVVAAARAAATTPATVLGLDDVGLIAPGRLANLVVLDEDLTVQAVMNRGSWVDGRAP